MFLHRIAAQIDSKVIRQKNHLDELIKNAMVPLDLKHCIHADYLRNIVIAFGICLFIGLICYTRHVILYQPQIPEGYLGGKLSDEEYKNCKP